VRPPKAGLLPLYIALYDDAVPGARPRVEAFAAEIAGALASRGIEVVSAPVCRLRGEFETAVKTFEK